MRRRTARPARSLPPSRRAVLVHRLSLWAVAPLIRPRSLPAKGRLRLTVVLMMAHEMTGVSRAVFNIAGHLAGRYDVEIVSVIQRRRRSFFAFPQGVGVKTLENQQGVRLRGWRRLLRAALRRFKSRLVHPADILAPHATLWTDLLLVRHLRAIRSGIVITTRPSLNLLGSKLARPGVAVVGQEHRDLTRRVSTVKASIRRGYGGLACLVVLTDMDRHRYDQFLQGATRVHTIPNALSRPEGPLSDLSHPIVLAAGRLTAQKGFDRLIPAFAQVVRHESEWALRICGSGPRRESLGSLILEYGAANNVRLVGEVGNIAAEMEQASMFVLSSRSEGFPMVLLEAMSNGLPVVSFDCPNGPAEIIEDGRNGFLVPNGDVEGLSAAILELVRDERKRKRFGAAAAERAEEYMIPRVGALWDDLLSEVVSGLGAPRSAA